ncbi:MAG: hypothetical protein KKA62_04030 [Nanoarchaeota archaeon]|nr:hypothetical protein [Nanoarchaeota archaeon]MBU1643997.1 hypothetical protein [Nanoarchaeota archaeon]MBU1977092.1 hypothetical protein [Nanoarchaeota archaeon]
MNEKNKGIYCTPLEDMLKGDESPEYVSALQRGYERLCPPNISPWGSGQDASMFYMPGIRYGQDGKLKGQDLSWGRATELARDIRSGKITGIIMDDRDKGLLYACVMRSLDLLSRGGQFQQNTASQYHPQEIVAALYLLDRVEDPLARKVIEKVVQKSEIRGLREIFAEEFRKYGHK